jgi:hypothetical protein
MDYQYNNMLDYVNYCIILTPITLHLLCPNMTFGVVDLELNSLHECQLSPGCEYVEP